MPCDQPGKSMQRAKDTDHNPAAASRRHRFFRFLLWNVLGSLAIVVPLFFLAPLMLTVSFFGLMVFMSAVVAGYFALLRVEE
jgi:hypothetical protein